MDVRWAEVAVSSQNCHDPSFLFTFSSKVEVYRSKSVGHEPSADEAASGGQAGDGNISGAGLEMDIALGMDIGAAVGDTNVKIHLEVLEICDNEEAMDSVSIISNISQSSTHARSPSLRYSRRENRFVSCDLGETASYSLLIPGSSNPEVESINISIPDTVEAHRQNSLRQTRESLGYREEIQLLNEAYMRQAGEREEWSWKTMFGGHKPWQISQSFHLSLSRWKELSSDPNRNFIQSTPVFLLEYFLFYDHCTRHMFVEYVEISLHKAKESRGKDYRTAHIYSLQVFRHMAAYHKINWKFT